MLRLLKFIPAIPSDEYVVESASDVPKELDVYYRVESQFLPEGKTFDDLTDEEKITLKNKTKM